MTATLDLRREVAKDPLCLPEAETLRDSDRALAIDSWRRRMASEHASARVFAGLVPQAIRAGVPHRDIVALSRMIEQELSHGLLCARVVVALGGDPEAALDGRLEDVPLHDDAPPLEALLRNVISVSCLHETIAVALIAAEREQVRETAPLGFTFERVLADEVKHARFGWRLLERVAPTLDGATRERLGAYLVVAFEKLISQYAGLELLPVASKGALAVGTPDGASQAKLVWETVRKVISPGLERHGIPARAAWSAALSPA